MEAIIFIGIQGAGKSTFFKERFFDTHVRINLDTLRTRRREEILLNACLQSRQPFVVDNTNPLPADRSRYLGPARANSKIKKDVAMYQKGRAAVRYRCWEWRFTRNMQAMKAVG